MLPSHGMHSGGRGVTAMYENTQMGMWAVSPCMDVSHTQGAWVHVPVYTYMQVFVHVRRWMCVYSLGTYARTYICTYIHTVCMSVCASTNTYVLKYAHMLAPHLHRVHEARLIVVEERSGLKWWQG